MRALFCIRAKIIIFDEPTASLTPEEKKYFFDLVRDLKRRAVSIVFISHALEEALDTCGSHHDTSRRQTRRDGRCCEVRSRTHRPGDGRTRPFKYAVRVSQAQRYGAAGARVLTVQNLKMAPMVKNNSLSVFAGQITGVFGLVGAGRTETFKVVAGVLKRDFFHGGEVILARQADSLSGPRTGHSRWYCLCYGGPEGRRILRTMSVSRNIYLGFLARFPKSRFFLSPARGRYGRQKHGSRN